MLRVVARHQNVFIALIVLSVMYSFVYIYFRWNPNYTSLNNNTISNDTRSTVENIIDDDTLKFIYKGKLVPLEVQPLRHPNEGLLRVADVLSRGLGESLASRLSLTNATDGKSTILLWEMRTPFSLLGCVDWDCQITDDKNQLAHADAVVFDAPPLGVWQRPGQYFVFYSQESPPHSTSFQNYDNAMFNTRFNMTFGYRLDSPTASPYGCTVRLARSSRRSWTDVRDRLRPIIAKKSRALAWFVSNCKTPSRRETIIDALKMEITIDIYGKCGNMTCPRFTVCQEVLNSDYFFYFAAENSICSDYVTEKLWAQSFNYTVVPIVLRRRLLEGIAPPNSFIAVDDFADAVEMASYLRRVMSDENLYLEYFKWRTDYETVILGGDFNQIAERMWGICQICRLARQSPRQTFEIPNMKRYWDASCEDGAPFADAFYERSKELRQNRVDGQPSDRTSDHSPYYHKVKLHDVEPLNATVVQQDVHSLWERLI